MVLTKTQILVLRNFGVKSWGLWVLINHQAEILLFPHPSGLVHMIVSPDLPYCTSRVHLVFRLSIL